MKTYKREAMGNADDKTEWQTAGLLMTGNKRKILNDIQKEN